MQLLALRLPRSDHHFRCPFEPGRYPVWTVLRLAGAKGSIMRTELASLNGNPASSAGPATEQGESGSFLRRRWDPSAGYPKRNPGVRLHRCQGLGQEQSPTGYPAQVPRIVRCQEALRSCTQ